MFQQPKVLENGNPDGLQALEPFQHMPLNLALNGDGNDGNNNDRTVEAVAVQDSDINDKSPLETTSAINTGASPALQEVIFSDSRQ